ncbi:peptidase M18 [Lipomyces tetrasporus]|uniref:Peptidase M18 n=1 Tax=Lipomyces tetrasporus TaxID=54092 RepID=A0AAD7VRK2_9ASCO|nr:peptidase M18 [Lipomyces tetrasporus]KAJ8100132.1 peptidase M18 [Lipomyces tetrasporus]
MRVPSQYVRSPQSCQRDVGVQNTSDAMTRQAALDRGVMSVPSPFTPSERIACVGPNASAAGITGEFIDFIYENPTVFHATEYFAELYTKKGFEFLTERDDWTSKLKKGGKYFATRNGSSIVAFVVGGNYRRGNGAGIIAAHIDALTARIKPISKKPVVEGYTQIGVAPYSGTMTNTWWDRDLGLGGRVVVRNADGTFETKLLCVPYPVARIPTLAPHFGAPSRGPFNLETNTTPIIALEPSDPSENNLKPDEVGAPLAEKHNIRLLRVIASELNVQVKDLLNFDLELFDTQKGTIGGLDQEFVFCPRLDDKMCCFAAANALLNTAEEFAATGSNINVAAFFDNEEIGSLLKQGARGGLLESCITRVVNALGDGATVQQTYANSFLVSADVKHAVNPNFEYAYLPYHTPKLNVGITVPWDPNGHMTTDSESAAFLEEIGRRTDNKIQYFQIRNDSRSGGTIGPMLSSSLGCRSIDVGIPQLSMHSIRACTGSRDIPLGVKMFQAFYKEWEDVDQAFKRGEKKSLTAVS